MIDCLIVGDSIAVGVAPRLPQCTVNAKIGIPSASVIGRTKDAAILIVSAGSNDPDNPRLADNLRAIRAKTHGKVIWILPINKRAAGIVREVANENKDEVIAFSSGYDRVHPSSYCTLAQSIKKVMK